MDEQSSGQDGGDPARSTPVPAPQHPSYSLTLARLAAQAHRLIESVLVEEGLRLEDWRVLAHLAAQGPVAMSALAEAVLVTGPTLTRTVDRLVSVGLVYRNVGVQDRRKVLVHLSERGHALYVGLLEPVSAAELSALRSGASDLDLRQLASLLLAP